MNEWLVDLQSPFRLWDFQYHLDHLKGCHVTSDITSYSTDIRRIMRKYYEQLYANKVNNVEEMNRFLERYRLTKLKKSRRNK